jgi:hypothetical protein
MNINHHPNIINIRLKEHDITLCDKEGLPTQIGDIGVALNKHT